MNTPTEPIVAPAAHGLSEVQLKMIEDNRQHAMRIRAAKRWKMLMSEVSLPSVSGISHDAQYWKNDWDAM